MSILLRGNKLYEFETQIFALNRGLQTFSIKWITRLRSKIDWIWMWQHGLDSIIASNGKLNKCSVGCGIFEKVLHSNWLKWWNAFSKNTSTEWIFNGWFSWNICKQIELVNIKMMLATSWLQFTDSNTFFSP